MWGPPPPCVHLCNHQKKHLQRVLIYNGLILGGDPKPLYFFNAFQKGFLSDFQEKILYILLQSIPDEFIQNGWLADEYVLFVIPTIMKCKLK